jgi:hypothetical protein
VPYSPLIARKVGDVEKQAIWELHEPLEYINGIITITVPAGFQTDYASVPRVPIAYMLYGDTAHEAAVVHDYLYRIDSVITEILGGIKVNRTATKEEADRIFFIIMLEMGIDYDQAENMYKAVKFGGDSSWHKLTVADKLTGDYVWEG